MSGAKALHPPSAMQSEWAASRGGVYGFLAWLFLESPDTSFLQRMLDADVGSYVASLAAGGATHPMVITGLEEMREWLSANAHRPLVELRQELAVQQTWLFKGIAPGYGPPPPYEAVHRRPGAGVDPDIMLSLRRFYREAAAALPNPRERLDHLGLELDFMRFLCVEEGRLWGSDDAEGAARYRRIQRRFLGEHLVPWVPAYCRRLLAEPCAPFFHGLARMLWRFLVEDAGLLNSLTGEQDGPAHPAAASAP